MTPWLFFSCMEAKGFSSVFPLSTDLMADTSHHENSDEASLPHGGVRKSGWGRFNAEWGMEEFLKMKTVTYVE